MFEYVIKNLMYLLSLITVIFVILIILVWVSSSSWITYPVVYIPSILITLIIMAFLWNLFTSYISGE